MRKTANPTLPAPVVYIYLSTPSDLHVDSSAPIDPLAIVISDVKPSVLSGERLSRLTHALEDAASSSAPLEVSVVDDKIVAPGLADLSDRLAAVLKAHGVPCRTVEPSAPAALSAKTFTVDKCVLVADGITSLPMRSTKTATRHAEQRAVERTKLDPAYIKQLEEFLRDKDLPAVPLYHRTPDGAILALKPAGGQHVVATTLAQGMRPKGLPLSSVLDEAPPKIAEVLRRISSASKKGKRYTLRKDDGKYSCSCPDFKYRHSARGTHCKHIAAHLANTEKKADMSSARRMKTAFDEGFLAAFMKFAAHPSQAAAPLPPAPRGPARPPATLPFNLPKRQAGPPPLPPEIRFEGLGARAAQHAADPTYRSAPQATPLPWSPHLGLPAHEHAPGSGIVAALHEKAQEALKARSVPPPIPGRGIPDTIPDSMYSPQVGGLLGTVPGFRRAKRASALLGLLDGAW